MIRRTGHGFLLQLERSSYITLTILARLQQVNRALIDRLINIIRNLGDGKTARLVN